MTEATSVYVDFMGGEIGVGDTIVYPVRKGSSMWLNKAVVSGQRTDQAGKPYLTVYDPEAVAKRNVRIKNLHTVVVVRKADAESND